ncbi:MAG: DedA family protein/thiosulfate sulfurtransferase GlpE [Steroidobacteraceae bacterium]
MQNLLLSLSGQFGIAVVMLNVLLDQIGLPVPAFPTLILSGAVAAGSGSVTAELFAGASLACLVPDIGWYLAGRRYGGRVMKLLCRISLNPDSCVSQTQLRFERWGPGALLVAKFVPGLAIIAPPLAGATGMGWTRFVMLSCGSALLWVGVALSAGMLLQSQITQLLPHMEQVISLVAWLALALLLGYVAFKWWERRRFLRALRMARISVTELYELIEAGAAPVIVDVRSATARALEPRQVPGAISMTIAEVGEQLKALPRDKEIVLYCTCPNEASAAQVARVLMKHGFARVRPLHGGLDAWIAAGYTAEPLKAVVAEVILGPAPWECTPP